MEFTLKIVIFCLCQLSFQLIFEASVVKRSFCVFFFIQFSRSSIPRTLSSKVLSSQSGNFVISFGKLLISSFAIFLQVSELSKIKNKVTRRKRISLKIQNLFTFLINGADRYLITQKNRAARFSPCSWDIIWDINLMVHKNSMSQKWR